LAVIPTPQSSTATEFDRAVLLRSDHQFARPSDERLHRFNAIDHQIKDHLLELDPICKDQGQGWSEFHLQRNPAAPQLMLHQRDNFVNDVSDVERYFPRGCLVHEGTDALWKPFEVEIRGRSSAVADVVESLPIGRSHGCRISLDVCDRRRCLFSCFRCWPSRA
jgi:hypothetical protein